MNIIISSNCQNTLLLPVNTNSEHKRNVPHDALYSRLASCASLYCCCFVNVVPDYRQLREYMNEIIGPHTFVLKAYQIKFVHIFILRINMTFDI